MASATRAPSKTTVPVPADDEAGALSLQRVAEIQRVRMLRAMVEVAAQRGASNVTVAHVVARSGVSRRTFYEVFKDCEDCLLAALDDAIGQARRTVLTAYRSKREWHAQMRAALTALLELFEGQPDTARFLVGWSTRLLRLTKVAITPMDVSSLLF
jgi:AcrR family transcriptional regulator